MPEKISSLHDDFEVPFEDRGKPEYDLDLGYPHRKKGIGERGENSVAQRISQFGITPADLASAGVTNLSEISQERYSELMKEAIAKQYDTLFASVFGHWSELPSAEDQAALFQKVSGMYRNWGMNLIGKGSAPAASEPNMVIVLEGADVVRKLGDVDRLYAAGIRCVAPQYNVENSLADDRGLTDFGKKGIKKMLDLGVIIDLAHAVPATRGTIMDMAESDGKGSKIAYTHGATVEDIKKDAVFGGFAEKRGISQAETKRIIKLGGIIGLGISRPFFQSTNDIVGRIDQICHLDNGPHALGLGTDFGGVAPEWLEATGIRKVEDLTKIADSLSEQFGYDDAVIRNILRENVKKWIAGT